MHFYLGLYGDSGNEKLGIKESEPGHTGVCLVLCVSDNHHGPTPQCLSKGIFCMFLLGEEKKWSLVNAYALNSMFYQWYLM